MSADDKEKSHLLHALDDKFIAVGPVLGRGAFGVVRFGGVYTSPPSDGSNDDTNGTGSCTAAALKDIPMTKWRAVAREVIAMVRCLGHPNIVRLQGIRRLPPDLDAPYERAQLVLDYAAGGNLAGIAASWTHALGDKNAGDGNEAVGNVAAAGGGRDSAAASCDHPRGIPELLACKYIKDLFEALVCVHDSGLAHCDVKGANMLLASDGRALLSDFGSCYLDSLLDQTEEQVAAFLAPMNTDSGMASSNTNGATPFETEENRRALFPSAAGGTGPDGAGPVGGANSPQERGTLRWTPPEMIGGGNSLGSPSKNGASSPRAPIAAGTQLQQLQAADIWAAGCTLLELLTGTPPWWWLAADSADVMVTLLSTDVRKEVPRWMSPEAHDFVLKCLNPEPMQRAKAAELLRHPFLAGYSPMLPLADAPFSQLRVGLSPSSSSSDAELLEKRKQRMQRRTAAVSIALAHSRLSEVPLPVPVAGAVTEQQPTPTSTSTLRTPSGKGGSGGVGSLGSGAAVSKPTMTLFPVDVSCSAKYAIVCLSKLESIGRIACRTLQRRLEAAAAAAASAYGARGVGGSLSSPRGGGGGNFAGSPHPAEWIGNALYSAASVCSCRGRETVSVDGLWSIWERSLLLQRVFRDTTGTATTTHIEAAGKNASNAFVAAGGGGNGLNSEEVVARYAYASKLVRSVLFKGGSDENNSSSSSNNNTSSSTASSSESKDGGDGKGTSGACLLKIQLPHSQSYEGIVFGKNAASSSSSAAVGGVREEVFGPTSSSWLLLATKVADELSSSLPLLSASSSSSLSFPGPAGASMASLLTATTAVSQDSSAEPLTQADADKLQGLSFILKALLLARVRLWSYGEAAFGRFGLNENIKTTTSGGSDSKDDDDDEDDDEDDDDDGGGWKRMAFACCDGGLAASFAGKKGLASPSSSSTTMRSPPRGKGGAGAGSVLSLRSLYLLQTWLASARRSLVLAVPPPLLSSSSSSSASAGASGSGGIGPHLSPVQPLAFNDGADIESLVQRTLYCASVMPRVHAWCFELSLAIRMVWLLRLAEAQVLRLEAQTQSTDPSSPAEPSDAFLTELQTKVAACWVWLQSLWVHASGLADVAWTEQFHLFGSSGLLHHNSGGGASMAGGGGSLYSPGSVVGSGPGAMPAPSPSAAASSSSADPAELAYQRLAWLVEEEDDDDDDKEGKEGEDDEEIEWTDEEDEDEDEEEEEDFEDHFEDEDEEDFGDDDGEGKRGGAFGGGGGGGGGRKKSSKSLGKNSTKSRALSTASAGQPRHLQLRTAGRSSSLAWVTRADDLHLLLGHLQPRLIVANSPAASVLASPTASTTPGVGAFASVGATGASTAVILAQKTENARRLKHQAIERYQAVLSNAEKAYEAAAAARDYAHYCNPYGPAATAPWQKAALAQLGRLFMAIADFYPDDGGSSNGSIPLQQGEVVLCLAEDESGWWCVRRLTRDNPFTASTKEVSTSTVTTSGDGRALEGWVPAGYLCRISFNV